MKGLTEITLLDSTHNLGLRCKLERDLFRVVERLSADTGEATRKETVNAIGLTRLLMKVRRNLFPNLGPLSALAAQVKKSTCIKSYAFRLSTFKALIFKVARPAFALTSRA